MKQIDLRDRKMRREHALGMAWHADQLIEIDPRQNPKERCDTLLHEALHLLCPDWNERRVAAVSKKITKLLWRDGFRRMSK